MNRVAVNHAVVVVAAVVDAEVVVVDAEVVVVGVVDAEVVVVDVVDAEVVEVVFDKFYFYSKNNICNTNLFLFKTNSLVS